MFRSPDANMLVENSMSLLAIAQYNNTNSSNEFMSSMEISSNQDLYDHEIHQPENSDEILITQGRQYFDIKFSPL